MRSLIKNAIKKFGYDLRRTDAVVVDTFAPDVTTEEKEIYEKIKAFTMTDIGSVISVIHAVNYVVENRIEGDIVECGVWRGGSMMAIALALKNAGDRSRRLYLYDTFSGMVEPTEKDRQYNGKTAAETWRESSDGSWCDASLEDVKKNMASTEYPADEIHYIEGRIEDTIPQTIPGKIALLRLDTDWYESTKHELEHLYPLLAPRGVLIIDDYGHWSGAKTATVEFFSRQKFKPFLHRIDYTRRLIIKPDES